jgi:hypothetical protein
MADGVGTMGEIVLVAMAMHAAAGVVMTQHVQVSACTCHTDVTYSHSFSTLLRTYGGSVAGYQLTVAVFCCHSNVTAKVAPLGLKHCTRICQQQP